DIFKPLGIRSMERLPGGYGMMADDILSGIYSVVVLVAIQLLFHV
ncbi:MAG: phosphatidylglycerophosphatase A, partial [Paramuribaculum sp.]|nr:phosphatidylglycerophosphatase A [Paramuribaculum sp.]